MSNFKGNYKPGAYGKLSKKKQEAYCEAIRLGLSKSRAARLIGVSLQTVDNWYRWGQEEGCKKKYFQFFKRVTQSQEQFVEDNLKIIREAAQGGKQLKETRITYNSEGKIKEEIVIIKDIKPTWQAGSWLLERKHPAEFSQHSIIEDRTAEKVAEDLEGILNA